MNDSSFQNELVLNVADYPDFISAYTSYIQRYDSPKITEAAIAIANPINGDTIKMTNHNWDFSLEEARRSLRLS